MACRASATVFVVLVLATPAFAQRVPFTRTFDVGAAPALEVTTSNGKITVTAGQPGRVVVRGTVTVRVGVNVPADAMAIAEKIAANPPVRQTADLVALTTPTDSRERRAVTVSYEVEVPPAARVQSISESGETSVTGVDGPVSVRTQSASIAVGRLGGNADVVTGSGAVRVNGAGGALSLTTSSSGIEARDVAGSLRVQTQSGAVDVSLRGPGPVHIRTGSSGVRLQSLAGTADVETGSGRIEVALATGAALRLDATTGSGSIDVTGVQVTGEIAKRRVTGVIGAGGREVRLVSRSGSIKVTR
jgi:DUF4097 and DUF4098 domain-containing protein YvlB